MKDQNKTKQQLIEELGKLRKQNAGLERLSIEQKLAEEKYRSLVDSTTDSVYAVDKDLRYTYVNKQNLARFDLPLDKVIGKIYGNFHSQEGTAKFKERINSVFRTRRSKMHEYRSERDGKYFLRTYSPIIGADGKPEAVTVVSKDISDLKKTEEALQESEEKFRLLSEQNLLGIIIIQDGFVKYTNQAACEITEYSSEEAHTWGANGFARLFHPDDLEFVMEQAKKKKQGENDIVTHYSYRILTKSGKATWVDQYSKTVSFEGRNADLITIVDITKRKRAEEVLRLRENQLSLIYDSVIEVLYYLSVEPDDCFRFLSINKAFLDATGLTKDQIVGKRIEEVIPEPSVWIVKDNYKKAIKENRVVRWEETSVYPAGEKIGDVSIAPILNEKRICTHLIGSVHDITEHIRAEKALKKSEQELALHNKINQIFLTFPDKRIYSELLNLILEKLESKFGTFGYFNEEGGFIVPALTREIYWDKCQVSDKDVIFERGTFSGIWARAIKEKKALYSNEGPFSYPEGHIPIENTMVAPIIYKNRIISAIHVANKKTGYDDKDREFLEAIAKRVAPVLSSRIESDRREAKRKKAELELENIFNLSPDMVGVFNTEGGLLKANPSWEKILGYTQKELLDLGWAKLVHPDDVEKTNKEVERQLKGSSVVNFVNRYRCKDGSYKTFEWQATIAKEGIVHATARDITKRKQAEKKIRLHTVMMDNVTEGIYLIGLDDLIIKWTNEKFTRMFGYDPGEMVGKQVDIVNAPTEKTPAETRISIVNLLKETGEWHGEVRNIKRDGTLFWCYANVSLFDHPEYGKVIVSVHTDITKRKQAEKELSKERTLLKAIIDNIPVLLTQYDPHTNMLYLNKEFEKIVGWKTEEVKDIDMMEKVYPDPDYRKQAREYMLKASTAWREFRVQSKSGKIINSEWSNIRLDDGTQIGIGIDITKRKQAEEDLKKYHADLKRLSTQLIYAQEAERKRISQELHDEVGQALTALKINLATITSQLQSDIAPAVKERFVEATNLTDNLLDQIQNISLNLRPSILDDLGLVPALRWYIRSFEKRTNIKAQFKTVNVKERFHPEIETSIYRIVQEALTNMAKYAAADLVNINLKDKKSEIEFSIEDNGKGFDLEKVRSRPPSTHGIGLLGIQERITLLKGTMQILTQPKMGTKIIIKIPKEVRS